MTANERTKVTAGDRFGALITLRHAGRGAMLCVCRCQHSLIVEMEDLLSGAVTSCPHCAPDPPERRKALREEAASITAGSEKR
jgi:hypothetical protein